MGTRGPHFMRKMKIFYESKQVLRVSDKIQKLHKKENKTMSILKLRAYLTLVNNNSIKISCIADRKRSKFAVRTINQFPKLALMPRSRSFLVNFLIKKIALN